MDESMNRVLNTFSEMKSDRLDLHTLFEAGGNDPSAREKVLEVVAWLVQLGLLEPSGSDFYTLTAAGRQAINQPSRG
jgi:hypothetical protein